MSAAIAKKRCLIALPIRDFKLIVSGMMLFHDRADCIRCVLNALVEVLRTGERARSRSCLPTACARSALTQHVRGLWAADEDRMGILATNVLPVLAGAFTRFSMYSDIVHATASIVWMLARNGVLWLDTV